MNGLIPRLGAIYLLCGAAVLFALGGCARTPHPVPEPRVVTVEKMVAVASPCVPATLEPTPEYPDTDAALKAASGPAQRYKLIGAGRPLRVGRLNELEGVVAGCPRAAK